MFLYVSSLVQSFLRLYAYSRPFILISLFITTELSSLSSLLEVEVSLALRLAESIILLEPLISKQVHLEGTGVMMIAAATLWKHLTVIASLQFPLVPSSTPVAARPTNWMRPGSRGSPADPGGGVVVSENGGIRSLFARHVVGT